MAAPRTPAVDLVRAAGVADRRAAGLTRPPDLMIARTLKITRSLALRHLS